MEGWIKLHRSISDNDLWTSEPFSRGQAFVDLLLLASHKDSFFYKRGVKVQVKRGQLAWSESSISERWKWSRNKVRKFLKDLEKEQQIEQQKSQVISVITIINYNKFQEKGTTESTTNETTESTTEGHIQECIKNDKNVKEKKKERVFLFSKSKFNDYETTKYYLAKQQKYIEKYRGVDLRHYIDAVDKWSDRSGKKTTDRGWIAYIREFMDKAIENNSLVKLEKAETREEKIARLRKEDDLKGLYAMGVHVHF
jgi:hypothetical protein